MQNFDLSRAGTGEVARLLPEKMKGRVDQWSTRYRFWFSVSQREVGQFKWEGRVSAVCREDLLTPFHVGDVAQVATFQVCLPKFPAPLRSCVQATRCRSDRPTLAYVLSLCRSQWPASKTFIAGPASETRDLSAVRSFCFFLTSIASRVRWALRYAAADVIGATLNPAIARRRK